MVTDTEPPPDLDEAPPEIDRPYGELGGLARPDAYFGAKELDCYPPPPKDASGRPVKGLPNGCGAPAGEKCVVWVDRLGRFVPRKMPCISRIQHAKEAGLL
jgi:hypothetical protein